jgi:hypothetical protein
MKTMTSLIYRAFTSRAPRMYPRLPRTLRAVLLAHDVPAADTHEVADAVEMAALVCDALAAHADPSDLYTRALFQQTAKELHQIAAP